MKYYNVKKKQKLPNKKIDEFLTQLHFLCKKYKLTISNPKGSMSVKPYNKINAKHMLGNVNDETVVEKEKDDDKENI
jgi:hypothetical protein